jgi:hypothetical protein
VRGVAAAALLAVSLSNGCAHAPPPVIAGPELEVALDEGRPDQRPLTPGQPFEMLIRVDPKLPAWRPLRMRFQMAQPGHVVFTLYAVDGAGRPGAPLKTIDRNYGPELIGAADDGKWVVEDLSDVPTQRAPIFVGLYSPEKHADPRLWATSNDSGQVFQRDPDPTVPLSSMKIPRTPRLRVAVAPAI